MPNVNCKILLVLLALGFGANDATRAVELGDIDITSRRSKIKLGEPFVFRLTYRFEKPLVSERTQQAPNAIDHHAYFRLTRSDDGSLVGRYRVHDVSLKLQDAQGLEYAENCLIFYDFGWQKLIFERPGTYIMEVEGMTKKANPLTINVGPASKADKRAVSLLSDPNDYSFLVHGSEGYVYERAERISHLKAVADQCKGALLAKWCGARLGIEYFRDFHRKHPSFQRFKAEREQGAVDEPLFDLAHKYLRIGAEMPDEFPIREEVLYQLTRPEWIMDNYERVFSLLDELSDKYPTGTYGRRAANARIELEELRKREQEQSQPVVMEGLRNDWVLPVFVAVAVAIFVVGLVLVLLLKKKAHTHSK